VSRPFAFRILYLAIALLVVGLLLIGFDKIISLRYAAAGLLIGLAVRLLLDLAAMPWDETFWHSSSKTPANATSGSTPPNSTQPAG
jgi:hypothetical protein